MKIRDEKTASRPHITSRKVVQSAFFWTLAEQLAQAGMTALVFYCLTQMLDPKDFGAVGLVTVFAQLARTLTAGGLNGALVRKEKPTATDYSTAFTANIIVAAVLYALMFACAPFIADYYAEPRLKYLIPIVCLSFVFESFVMVQHANITKAVNFRLRSAVVVPSTLLSGVIAIAAGAIGAGAVSIALFLVLGQLFEGIILWIITPWKPTARPSWTSWKSLGVIGVIYVGRNFVAQSVDSLPALTIGRVYGVSTLGFYNNAMKINQLSIRFLIKAVSQVLFPLTSAIQNDKGKIQRMMEKGAQLLSFIVFPVSTVIFIESHDIVYYGLGDRWIPIAPFLRVFAIGGLLRPYLMLNDSVLKVIASPSVLAWRTLFRLLFAVITIYFSSRFGAIAIAMSVVVINTAETLFGVAWTRHVIGHPVMSQIRCFWLPAKICMAVGIPLALFDQLPSSGVAIDLIAPVIVAAAAYLGIAKLINAAPLLELMQLAKLETRVAPQ